MSSSLEESIFRSLRRIVRATDLNSRRLMSSHHITTPQLVCLRHLFAHGPCTTGELSRDVYLSGATITGIVDRLEDRGLLMRERAKPDRRKVTVKLTEAGTRLVKEAPVPLQAGFAKKLSGLAPAEQEEIDRVLKMVVGMMEAQDLAAAPMIAAGDQLEPTAEADPDPE